MLHRGGKCDVIRLVRAGPRPREAHPAGLVGVGVLSQGLLGRQPAARANNAAIGQAHVPPDKALGLKDVAVTDLQALADTTNLRSEG